MAQSQTLTGLTPREAVADALHRAILGMDSKDHELFASAVVQDEDASIIFGPNTLQGWKAIIDHVSKMFGIVTHHNISSIRVHLEHDEATTATMTAHSVAYHIRPDDAFKPELASYTAGCLYYIDLVKDSADGLWKMKRWELRIQWTNGDPSILPV